MAVLKCYQLQNVNTDYGAKIQACRQVFL